MSAQGVSLYIHVPFCASKCAYCDFASVACDPQSAEAQYLFAAYHEAVMRELDGWRECGLLRHVPTVYVGGGTPTLLGSALPDLVRDVIARCGGGEDVRVAIEANPDALDETLVDALVGAGVNRISLGVQSLDDDVLAWLGRRHTASDALRTAALVRDAGLRLSLDLMCGIPVQTPGSWEWTVHDAIEVGAGHVSVYPLSVEPDTPLFALMEADEQPDPDPDVAADQMTYAAAALRAAGYERYEVASYARPGEECRHNVRYWSGGAYLGIGPTAASMLPAADAPPAWHLPADAARVRFTMHTDVASFHLSGVQRPVELETLPADAVAREDAMLGLRLSRGITDELAQAAGARGALASLEREGLVERLSDGEQQRWRSTERGWLLGNEIFTRIWTGE